MSLVAALVFWVFSGPAVVRAEPMPPPAVPVDAARHRIWACPFSEYPAQAVWPRRDRLILGGLLWTAFLPQLLVPPERSLVLVGGCDLTYNPECSLSHSPLQMGGQYSQISWLAIPSVRE